MGYIVTALIIAVIAQFIYFQWKIYWIEQRLSVHKDRLNDIANHW